MTFNFFLCMLQQDVSLRHYQTGGLVRGGFAVSIFLYLAPFRSYWLKYIMLVKFSCHECESSIAMITKCHVPKCVLFAAQVQIPPPPGTKINISRRSSEERNKSKNTRKHHKCAYSWPKKNFESFENFLHRWRPMYLWRHKDSISIVRDDCEMIVKC